jgi:hypothetical protein
MYSLIETIDQTLLPDLTIESCDPHDPIVVHYVSAPWQVLGAGNYAAVFIHPGYPDEVVKVYAPGRPGFEEEREVYDRLGVHPAFSQCIYAHNGVLVLKRLYGVTLYDCMHRGIRVPVQVIQDIDRALDHARDRGLHPHDVHGRNVMMWEGRGYVVDVSDFLHEEACSAWTDLKRAYYWIYRPILCPLRVRIPYSLLNAVRKTYRWLRSLRLKKR